MSSSCLDEIKQLTKDDAELQTVIRCVSEGWSKYASKVPISIMQYSVVKINSLTTSSNLLLYGDGIVFPNCQRAEIVNRIHDGHVRCKVL